MLNHWAVATGPLCGSIVLCIHCAGLTCNCPKHASSCMAGAFVVQVLIGLKSELQQLLEQAATIDRSRGAAAGSQAGHEHVTDAASSSSTHTGNGTDSSTSSDIHLRGDVSGAGSKAGKQFLDDDHPFACAAIWQLPVMPLFFEAERPVTKQLAKDLMHVLAKTGVRS